jgi:glyoxylase-like metal-dependent hydrolase (beta-lactamase superfamily II)
VGGVFDADAVSAMVHKVFAGRVQFHEGDAELAPGITLHKVGGHTRGMQIVRVATERGWIVLGSDSAHFYANLEPGRPFPILDDLHTYVAAQRTALELASSPQHFIPGHDPLVLARYPSARTGLEDAVRLDLAPRN